MTTLEKAAQLLRAFSADKPEWGARELAAWLDWPPSSAHFYLSALAASGFLRRTEAGRYRLSWNLAEFAAQLTDALPWFSRARLALAEAAQATGGLGFLCVLEEGRVVCIARALGNPEADHARVQTDVTLPAGATAAGKLLYAHAKLPPPTFTRYTQSTITTEDEWAGELRRVRREGHAHAIEEWAAGECSLCVPLFWEGEVVAAFGVQLPTARFLPRERQLLARVRQAARDFAAPD